MDSHHPRQARRLYARMTREVNVRGCSSVRLASIHPDGYLIILQSDIHRYTVETLGKRRTYREHPSRCTFSHSPSYISFMKNKKYDIVGIGAATVDYLSLIAEFPSQESVHKAIASEIDGGGPVATALVTAARLGASTALIDSVGTDLNGKYILQGLRSAGVDTKHVLVRNNRTSSSAVVLVRVEDGARSIIYSPGGAKEPAANEIPEKLISHAKFIHINGRHFKASVRACEYAKKHNTLISFDGGSYRYRDELRPLVQMSNVAIVSHDFANEYTKAENIHAAGKALLLEGPAIVVITNGVQGSHLFTEDTDTFHQSAFTHTDVIDTTGCGDSYHGAFLFALCKNYDLKKAMEFASAVASINAMTLGGRAGLPKLNEVKKFLSKVKG